MHVYNIKMPSCTFCNSVFKTNSNLQRHIQHTKFCKDIQENREPKPPVNKECSYCNKILSSTNRLNYHQNICKQKPNIKKTEKLIEEKFKEIVEHKIDLMLENKLINQSNNTQSHNTSTNTNTSTSTNTQSQNSNEHSFNTNYISIIQYMTPDRVEETFAKNYTLSDLMGSQKALAEFTSEHFLNGANKPAYICTDRSRHHFAYMDETKGQIEDINANMLIRLAMRGFDTVTDTYKNKMIDLEKKLKLYEKEQDAATLVIDIRNQINELQENYAKTMNISKEGEGYRSKLSQILPTSLEKKTYEEEIFEQLRREDEAYAEKKRLAKLASANASSLANAVTTNSSPLNIVTEVSAAAPSAATPAAPVTALELVNRAIHTYRENPNKIFALVKNADGQRLVCGVPAGKLSVFRTYFRNEKAIKLSPLVPQTPIAVEEYIYWLHEEV